MITTTQLAPGVVLTHCPDRRFKKCALSIQLLRPMCYEEAALNALLPSVLLRGSRLHPDLRTITWRLDELYGASVHTMVRRVGNVQTVGLYLSLMEDRFALEPEGVLAPAVEFLGELLFDPLTENGVFDGAVVDSEKKNLISAIESELNDKRAYTAARMIRQMCQGDPYAVPRLGRVEDVAAITPEALYAHYRRILRESRAEITYVGAGSPERVAELLLPFAGALGGGELYAPDQYPLKPVAQPGEFSETMDVNQAKLTMGFTTEVDQRHPDYAAMQVFNDLFGAGMTSKLFVNVREKLGLCYYAGSAYYGSKGMLTVSSGIDECNYEKTRDEILRQLRLCAEGQITEGELSASKQSIVSALRSIPDSPGSVEGYYAADRILGVSLMLEDYISAVETVTAEAVARCAGTLKLHTVYFLKGEGK
ncbi:MAG: insulinase family protein [Oscillospiraceae bacterium]|nr:insulinase family protein [Oscillospiraceae bacterium]